jgi:hypothetical protein
MFENIHEYEKCIDKLIILNLEKSIEKCDAIIETTKIDSLKNTYAENEDNQYTLTKDFWIALILVVTTFIICKDYSYNDEIVASLYLISGIINFLLFI